MSAENRIRLLALVDVGFRPGHASADGPSYRVATGDLQWFQDNIPCQVACPAQTDVPRYIALLADGQYRESEALNREHNVFPGCLGRVCARPCEDACRRGLVDSPIAICSLKRAAYDYSSGRSPEPKPARHGLSAGIVGAGPAGLATARELARLGHQVVVYERHPVPGGMLWAGIPAWRLPREVILDEVDEVVRLGVEIRYGVSVGSDMSLEDLAARHDAVLIAVGCQDSVSLGIPGEDLDGVLGGLPFLEQVNLDGPADGWRGARVVTIGGGYTSLDCVRTALRLGASESLLAYRRDQSDIPVEEEELREAQREGVQFRFMASPVRILGEDGRVSGVEFVRNRLHARDGGKSRIEPIPGSEFTVPCDRVIVAIGQRQRDDLRLGDVVNHVREPGVPAVDADFRTDHPRVWATGDFVARPRNVISAIADGKRAAQSIDQVLRSTPQPKRVLEMTSVSEPEFSGLRGLLSDGVAEWSLTTLARRLREDDYLDVPRQSMPVLSLAARQANSMSGLAREVESGFTPDIAAAEAQRCLQCQLNIFIDGTSCILCNACVEVCPQQCIEMVTIDRLSEIDGDQDLAREAEAVIRDSGAAMLIHEASCVRCGRCVERCPTGCLTMDHFRAVESPVDAALSVGV